MKFRIMILLIKFMDTKTSNISYDIGWMNNVSIYQDTLKRAIKIFTFLFQLIECAIGTAFTTQLNFTSSSLLISTLFNFPNFLPTILNFIFGMSETERGN